MPRSDATPRAVVVTGSAGSGKSTIAAQVAERCGAVYLDKDSLAGPLVDAAMAALGHSTEERESSSFYRESIMPSEYEALLRVAGDNLRLGAVVVIDAPFAAYLDQPDYFQGATRVVNWPEVDTTVLQVFASEAETRRRLQKRGLVRDRAKLADWDVFWSRWGSVESTWVGVRKVQVDNSVAVDIDDLVAQIGLDISAPPDLA